MTETLVGQRNRDTVLHIQIISPQENRLDLNDRAIWLRAFINDEIKKLSYKPSKGTFAQCVSGPN